MRRSILKAIEAAIPAPYTAEGLYQIYAAGFLPTPYLLECRAEFPQAVQWRTRPWRGGVAVVDETGLPIPPSRRAQSTLERWKERPVPIT
ncbi:MAG TPA: hypothetical protein VKU00_06860 [Chthonomonadaceae bacterium]|nr:hypothetical protein [Chthonomonadaceae bacterium]